MTEQLHTLAHARCTQPAVALSDSEVAHYLTLLPDWTFDAGQIVKLYRFNNYYETIAFVNALAWIAHQQDHHPDLSVHYNRCRVAFSTHSVHGISLNDFICAAKIATLYP